MAGKAATIRDQINANLEGMGPTQLRKVLRYAQDVRREDHPDEGEPDVASLVEASRGPRKSRERIRIEALFQGPVGEQTSFVYGTFNRASALDTLCRLVGGKGWYEITRNAKGQVVRKVKEPVK